MAHLSTIDERRPYVPANRLSYDHQNLLVVARPDSLKLADIAGHTKVTFAWRRTSSTRVARRQPSLIEERGFPSVQRQRSGSGSQG